MRSSRHRPPPRPARLRASFSGPRPRRLPDGCRSQFRSGGSSRNTGRSCVDRAIQRPGEAIRVVRLANKMTKFWSDWLTRPDETGRVQCGRREARGAREAITRVCLGSTGSSFRTGCSWLRLWPQTGRTHQLRIQAPARGMPMCGDSGLRREPLDSRPSRSHRCFMHARSR